MEGTFPTKHAKRKAVFTGMLPPRSVFLHRNRDQMQQVSRQSISKGKTDLSSTVKVSTRCSFSSLSLSNSKLSKTKSTMPSGGNGAFLTTSHGSNRGRDERQDRHECPRERFYVRVWLESLTGLFFTASKKDKVEANNLVFAYAVLERSAKRMACSQPLGPFAEVVGERHQKVYWSKRNSCEVSQVSSATLSKRKLHFSLRLEKELKRDGASSSRAHHTNGLFYPEIVKLLIGLKCGEEQLPLGVANLVINGEEIWEQQFDISVRPMHCHHEGDATQSRAFNKTASKVFKFDKHSGRYHLASNATLRVKLDVKSAYSRALCGDVDVTSLSSRNSLGKPFERKREVKHILLHDETTDSSRDCSSHNDQAHNINELEYSEIHPEIVPMRNCVSHVQTNDSRQTKRNIPIKSILISTTDLDSVRSDLTAPESDLCSLMCFTFRACGGSHSHSDSRQVEDFVVNN